MKCWRLAQRIRTESKKSKYDTRAKFSFENKDDPNYVRELYCYDLFRRYGIWTAAHDVYCRLWLKVGDAEPAYFGVYEMIEPIEGVFLPVYPSDANMMVIDLSGAGINPKAMSNYLIAV